MRVLLANHSSYPPAGPAPGAPDPVVEAIVREQEAAGLDLITDGQPDWSDPVAPLMGRLDGVRLGALQAWPLSAAGYRQPIVQAKLRRRHPLCVDAYRRAARLARTRVKAVLTGPYTLASVSAIATTAYRGVAELAEDLSTVLAQEVAALAAAGAPVIQVDEPLLLLHPEDMRLGRELLEALYNAAGGTAEIVVTTYGADATDLYAQLNSLPADVVGFDCCQAGRLLDAIADTGAGKTLALGIVDAHTPALEDVSTLARTVERALRHYVHPIVYLQPSSGLAGLSRSGAQAKLRLLSDVRAQRPARDG